MKRNKRLFFILAALFFLIMLAIGYDIYRKTTWPGYKKDPKEQLHVSVPNAHNHLHLSATT